METDINNNVILNDKVQNVLQDVPALFKKFSPEDLHGFFKSGRLETCNTGDTIIDERSEHTISAWFVADGQLSVWIENMEVAHIGPGDFIGEEFLFSKGARTATVKAESDAVLVRFEREGIIDFFRKRPERLFKIFIMNMLEIQQRRIKAMNIKVARLQRKLMDRQPGELS